MQSLLKAAEHVVRQAGPIARNAFRNPEILQLKPNDDLVTQADRDVQDFVIGALSRQFPDHGFLAEETGGQRDTNADFVWVLDPIDGTKFFARGIPMYSISLALRRKDDLVLGIVYNPETERLYSACAETGAKLNGQLISCSSRKSLHDAQICLEIPNRHSGTEVVAGALKAMQTLVEQTQRVRIFGASALGLSYCASGGFDAYVNLSGSSRIWDIAAGLVILRESGARITTLEENRIIAGPPILHDALLRLLGFD